MREVGTSTIIIARLPNVLSVKRTHRSASVLLALENLEPLHDDAAGDDGVGCGDRGDDVSGH